MISRERSFIFILSESPNETIFVSNVYSPVGENLTKSPRIQVQRTRLNQSLIDIDEDGFSSDVDCDDDNAAINPGAEEICDEIDNDCDEEIDEDVLNDYFEDTDGDGFGIETTVVSA